MNREVLEKWKRNLVELETKVEKFNNDKNILINLLDEIKTNQNIKLNILSKDLELEEELSTLKEWIEFEEEKISRLRDKITTLEKELSQKEVEEIKRETAPIPRGERKPITAMDWASAFIPVITGTIATIFKKKKKPEEEEDEEEEVPEAGTPAYDEWVEAYTSL